MKITNTLCMLTTLLCFSGLASAADLSYLQKEWALANYQLTGDAQDMRFEQLIVAADKSVESHPNDAELLIWQGIIKSVFLKRGSLNKERWNTWKKFFNRA